MASFSAPPLYHEIISLTLPHATPQKPNIVIFLTDDMGLMDTSVPFMTDEHGKAKRYPLNDWYHTPNMQRLANPLGPRS